MGSPSRCTHRAVHGRTDKTASDYRRHGTATIFAARQAPTSRNKVVIRWLRAQQVSTGEPLRRLAVAREDSVSVRLCVWSGHRPRAGGRWLVFVPVEPRILCGACEPVCQHGAEGSHGNRGLLPLSTSVRLPIFSALPGTDIRPCWKGANCYGSDSSAVCRDRCVQA